MVIKFFHLILFKLFFKFIQYVCHITREARGNNLAVTKYDNK